ncbi:MAG: class I SAM-dependent methyltransferase [Phycisphaerales bacterium]
MHAIKKRLPWLIRTTLEIGQRFRLNISPEHFYSETPNLRHLRRTDYWRRPWPMKGVRGTALEPQLDWLRRTMGPWAERLRDGSVHAEACRRNGEEGFGHVESDLLYGFLRTHRPPKIVQVGCGVSTQVALIAAAEQREADGHYAPEVVCIDPHPSPGLRRLAEARRIRLLAEPAEAVPLAELTGLPAGSLLFVDSTHSTKIGGEVPRLILEVLGDLQPGVFVHFHDIHFPYDYGNWTLTHRELFFNRESTLLLAFLSFNDRFEIVAALSMLLERLDDLKAVFPRFDPCRMDRGLRLGPGDFPNSIYLRTLEPTR